MVSNKSERRVTLSISKETKAMLDSLKHTGQSYNGLIHELVIFWKQEKAREAEVDK